jgi:DnaK suppressor protein
LTGVGLNNRTERIIMVSRSNNVGRRASKDEPRKSAAPAKSAEPKSAGGAARKEAVAQLNQILIRRRDALRKALAGDLSSLKELRQQTSGDMMDAAMDTAQDEISSQLAEVESRELTHIETALERMRKGEYGVCEGCGHGIPLARLQALPYATMCIQCQREAEKSGDFGGNRGRSYDIDSESSADLEVDA